MKKINMTVNEVLADMRQNGWKMSPRKFNMMVDAGLLPFVKVLKVNDGGRRNQVIFRKDYENWKKEQLEGIA